MFLDESFPQPTRRTVAISPSQLNGDSLSSVPSIVLEAVEQPPVHNTAEQNTAHLRAPLNPKQDHTHQIIISIHLHLHIIPSLTPEPHQLSLRPHHQFHLSPPPPLSSPHLIPNKFKPHKCHGLKGIHYQHEMSSKHLSPRPLVLVSTSATFASSRHFPSYAGTEQKYQTGSTRRGDELVQTIEHMHEIRLAHMPKDERDRLSPYVMKEKDKMISTLKREMTLQTENPSLHRTASSSRPRH
ncbi:hypothetical protein BLNAU_12704 [Blattamonas nauphoetae]|uniref:Uncharacterized protein n=1 Tax=Blattamonas nauphoetae TaxID=2049346 RepID=A0ABQ9XLE2_9EUKA|nr:hypothetical protein BLNAU_12704 [Blattamonas nauphoetae]